MISKEKSDMYLIVDSRISYNLFVEKIKNRHISICEIFTLISNIKSKFKWANLYTYEIYFNANEHLCLYINGIKTDKEIVDNIIHFSLMVGYYPINIKIDNNKIDYQDIDKYDYTTIEIEFVTDYNIKLNHINTLYSMTTNDDTDDFNIYSSDKIVIEYEAKNILKEDDTKEIFLVENDLTDLDVDIFNSELSKDILKVRGEIPPNRKKILHKITKPIPIKKVISAPWF